MKKQTYQKPAMRVVKLQQQAALLTVSNPETSTAENFSWDDDE